jgi:hypothetical protein
VNRRGRNCKIRAAGQLEVQAEGGYTELELERQAVSSAGHEAGGSASIFVRRQ